MGSSSSRPVSTSSQTLQPANPASLVLVFRESPTSSDTVIVHPAGYPADAPPLYSIRYNLSSEPQAVLLQRSHGTDYQIGDAGFHAMSTKINLSLRGMPVMMKWSEWTGRFTIDYPPMGTLKWRSNKLTGSPVELLDSSDRKLAQVVRSTGGWFGPRKKELEILVPCDQGSWGFIEMVVFSGTVASTYAQMVLNLSMKIASGMA